MPIMTPTIGLERSSDDEKKEDKFLPPRILNDVLRKVNDTTKRYKEIKMPTVLKVADSTLFMKVGCWNFILTRVNVFSRNTCVCPQKYKLFFELFTTLAEALNYTAKAFYFVRSFFCVCV